MLHRRTTHDIFERLAGATRVSPEPARPPGAKSNADQSMTLDRRRFLQLTTAGVVASLSSSACVRDSNEDERALAQPELIDMLGAESVRNIGARYRAAMPEENTAGAARRHLGPPGLPAPMGQARINRATST